jgi:xanthine dehydrogenase accessory factor
VVGAGHVGSFAAPLLASLGFEVTLCDARHAAVDPARLVLHVGSAADIPPWSPEFGAEAALVATQRPDVRLGTQVRIVHAEHDDPEVMATFPKVLDQAVVLVMTHDHALDQAVIEWALSRGFGFVGGVGSRAKAARTRARLEAKGVPAQDVARLRMPVGLDIGARTPAEISVALAAELVAWRAEHRPRQKLRDGREAAGDAPEGSPDGRVGS